MPKNQTLYILSFASLCIIVNTQSLFAQNDSASAQLYQFTSNITVTTKGISTFPNLTVGKPAAIFEVIAGRRLTFEPQFRFTLEGMPWNFILWWRYKLITTDKFRMGIGAHPAFAFKTVTDSSGGIKKEHIRSDRYLAAEVTPLMMLTKHFGTGLHYIYARGVEEDVIKNTHFIAFRTVFTNIRITDAAFLRIVPQVYYLNMDGKDGAYFNAAASVVIRNFPLSISALINKSFKTEIITKDDLLWNISLTYTISNEYQLFKPRNF